MRLNFLAERAITYPKNHPSFVMSKNLVLHLDQIENALFFHEIANEQGNPCILGKTQSISDRPLPLYRNLLDASEVDSIQQNPNPFSWSGHFVDQHLAYKA
ncbi:hypothetical protein LMG27198_39440 [Methylocystis echinoides]|uniref:Uncharacterized protein n=1 Tax=Methylocystis echinoides TaxID=29468 RepID=A0A9W6GXS6_9HYPH|nr:hypothetical protein LMG27198_39440 [Methylocystis echinoides]